MIKIYADKECKKPIDTIEWDNEAVITLFSGERIVLPNTVAEGTEAIAKVWVRNEGVGKFYITSISFPDSRVKITIESDKLFPNRPVELTFSFVVPKNPTPDDVVKAGQINIWGYYVVVE